MQSKPQYTVQDWLNLHELTHQMVLDYCGVLGRKLQIDRAARPARDAANGLSVELEHSLQHLVLPSLNTLLNLNEAHSRDLGAVQIIQHEAGTLDLPYTEWSNEAKAPVVHVVWSGAAADLLCLAHEMGHALQMILSRGVFMPPVARELCAFLGELVLIRFAKTRNEALARDLKAAWWRENYAYLGRDAGQLVDDLKAESAPYHYRHNYPLARMAAMSLFATFDSSRLHAFFASGSAAMAKLPLPDILRDWRRCDAVHKPPQSTSADEDVEAFRLSLSPQALRAVRTGQVDYAWLYRPASAGRVAGNRVEAVSHFAGQDWVKWRSLGVFALAALNSGEAGMLPGVILNKFERASKQIPQWALSFTKPWVSPLGFDALTALGMAIQQLATSPYHQTFKLSQYLPVEILPPLQAGQLCCYLDGDHHPAGFTTWAWLCEQQKQEIHQTGRALQPTEWSGGTHPFVNDWITQPAAFRAVMTEKRDVIFPNHTVSSLRRNPGGSVRRLNTWPGRNMQKQQIAKRSDTPN